MVVMRFMTDIVEADNNRTHAMQKSYRTHPIGPIGPISPISERRQNGKYQPQYRHWTYNGN